MDRAASVEYSVGIVPPKDIPALLPLLIPYMKVSAEVSGGRSAPEDIMEFLATGRMLLWSVIDGDRFLGYFITEIYQYPQKTMLIVQYASMDAHTLKPVENRVHEIAENFARDAGCDGVEFIGRPGWKKAAEANGYKLRSVMYEKLFGGEL